MSPETRFDTTDLYAQDSNEQPPITKVYNRRQFLEIGAKFVLAGIVVPGLAGCDTSDVQQSTETPQSSSVPVQAEPTPLPKPTATPFDRHPTPITERSERPADTVVLYEQPANQIMTQDGRVTVYQNTPNDFEHMPVIISISPERLEALNKMIQKNNPQITASSRVVIAWPGPETGSTTKCEPESMALLYPAKGILDEVMNRFGGLDLNDPKVRGLFLAEMEASVNYQIVYNLQLAQDCEAKDSIVTAQQKALKAEYEFMQEVGAVLFLDLKPNVDLNAAMQYARDLIER